MDVSNQNDSTPTAKESGTGKSGKPSLATDNIDYEFKIILVGKGGVGKTSLLHRFKSREFNPTPVATLGVDYATKLVQVKGKTIKLNLWDTTGQERFRSVVGNFFRGAHGALVVYDVTDTSSFEDIEHWEDDMFKYCTDFENDIVKVLIGNKVDLSDRKVSIEEGKERAERTGMSFYETSAKEDIFVDIAFLELVTKILENESIIKSLEGKEKNLKLQDLRRKSISKKCC